MKESKYIPVTLLTCYATINKACTYFPPFLYKPYKASSNKQHLHVSKVLIANNTCIEKHKKRQKI